MGETEKALCFSGFKFLFVSLFWGDFGQELFSDECHAFVISRTKGENWDGTDFKMGVTARCSEYNEWILLSIDARFSTSSIAPNLTDMRQ